MEKRNVEITLDTARKWYYGDNESLREVALQAFTKDELEEKHWRNITTIKDAVDYLIKKGICKNLITEYVNLYSHQSYIAKVLEYQIVVAALTNNEERHLITGEGWFPVVQFCEHGKEKNCQHFSSFFFLLHLSFILSTTLTLFSGAYAVLIIKSSTASVVRSSSIKSLRNSLRALSIIPCSLSSSARWYLFSLITAPTVLL